jgi:L-alanine-DL-glutamate epimerase-like enolase superfamily enzyme
MFQYSTINQEAHMKITKIQTAFIEVPADEPLADGPQEKGAVRKLVGVKISTDQGLQGISVAFFGAAITPALKSAIDSLGALTIGMNPLAIEAIHAKLREAGSHAGPGGIFTLASSAIDIALWDIKGRAFEKPVSELLGGFRKTVPTYASGALMRGFSLKQVVKSAETLVKNENAVGVARLHQCADRSGSHQTHPRSHRRQNRFDVRHQSALGRAPGDFHRQAG